MTEAGDDAPVRRDPDAEPSSSEEVPPREVVREMVQAEVAYVYQGPLPDPETLRGYNGIVPGAAERIISRMEREGDHRHATEKRGQFIGACVAGAGLIGGFTLIVFGHDVAGVVFTGSGIAPWSTLSCVAAGEAGDEKTRAAPSWSTE